MELIRVADMLQTMQMRNADRTPIPFSIRFVTCDQKQGTGGKRIEYSEAVLVGGGVSKSEEKNPGHFANYTRNLKGIGTEQIRKFHPLLVEEFNGKKVIL